MFDHGGLWCRRLGGGLRSLECGDLFLLNRLCRSFGFKLRLSLLDQHGRRGLGGLWPGPGFDFSLGFPGGGSGGGTLDYPHSSGRLVQGKGRSLMCPLDLALEGSA
jgi:hypothetical protein